VKFLEGMASFPLEMHKFHWEATQPAVGASPSEHPVKGKDHD